MMATDAAASSPADATAIAIHDTADRLQPPQLPPASPTDGVKDGGSTLSPRGPVRVNGLEGPCSSDQVIACTGHLVSAVLLYFVAGSFLLHSEKDFSAGLRPLTIVMLILHVPAMFLIMISWWSCEKIDPSRPIEETLPNGWLGFKLSGPRWEKTRYCAVCRKAVPGLDHHCTWLQTCVGKANYAQFFTIAVAGTVQFLSQTLYATMCLVWLDLPYETTSDVRIAMQGVLIGLLLISVPCTLMYFILLGFHVYLHMLGYGTYEWMLRRRRKQRARAAEAAAAQGSSSSTTTATKSKRMSASRMTQRDTETSDARDSRLSSVGSANDFISQEDATTSSKSAQHELTAL